MSVTDFVLHGIQHKYSIDTGVDVMKLNYIEEGYVDSMGLIQFMVEIEDEFGIEFTDDEIASPKFKVVGELIAMIEKKVAEQA